MSIIRSNAHTHTVFCDGKNSVEEMVQAAIGRNFLSLGFSIHGFAPHEIVEASLEKEALYRDEVRRVREKYGDRIEILLGVEKDGLYADYDPSPYEYHIDSIHWFAHEGQLFPVDFFAGRMDDGVKLSFGGDYYAYTRAYYAQVAKMCAASKADFIGHIDLVTKFNEGGRQFDESDPRYLGPAKEAVQCAVERGIPLEMNTGAISRGYRSAPYPNPLLLRFIREQGGQVIVNSDAHSAEGIDTAFGLCLELLRAEGFDHVLRLRASGMEELGI